MDRNQQYSVFTNFHCSFVDRVFSYENIKDEFGEIPQELIDNHLNSCELGTFKESLWVVMHLYCPIKGLYTVSSIPFAL